MTGSPDKADRIHRAILCEINGTDDTHRPECIVCPIIRRELVDAPPDAVSGDLRCYVTGNPAGSDTWPKGYVCACRGCITYMSRIVGLEAEAPPPERLPTAAEVCGIFRDDWVAPPPEPSAATQSLAEKIVRLFQNISSWPSNSEVAALIQQHTAALTQEVERLNHLHGLDHSLADQWKAELEEERTRAKAVVEAGQRHIEARGRLLVGRLAEPSTPPVQMRALLSECSISESYLRAALASWSEACGRTDPGPHE